ncbi:hypothetical protein [Actinoplanes sp. G11-F43]|uniref:hypothetical protein n=1 Tax=Actinoplanes sp. G11-F43 TaxID=3424130 RepID=UPI003D338617
MSLFDDVVWRLRDRAAGLGADLRWWRERTAENGDLPQHHTQVLRLGDFLEGMLAEVMPGTAAAGGVDDLPTLRRGVGSVHLVWDFYRDKLTQRDTGAFADHLGAADDLAWACYQPFLDAAAGTLSAADVREPPLVFYSTDRTPFAQARTRTLHPPGLDAKDLVVFEAALQRLPVPVIGVPWELANRMPELTLVGHEAGHVVAEDLRLAAEARSVVSAAISDGVRQKVWISWCDEVFADVIGVLATGTAYLDALTVELADTRAEIRDAPIRTGNPGRYPTRVLRVALCSSVLTRLGLTVPGGWAETYGPVGGPSDAYAADVDLVVAALTDHAWAGLGGKRLAEVLPWDAGREKDAHTVGGKESLRRPVPVRFDVRVWAAAAMHAYRLDPARYAAGGLDALLARRIVDQRRAGTRSSESTRAAAMTREHTPHDVDPARRLRDADRSAGAEFARLLVTRRSRQ